jgi:protocatechuate 3,4-dioxygenase beta subunit
MRLFAAVLVLAAGCMHAQTADLLGTVVDQTGKPLAGVHVRLITGDFGTDDDSTLTVYGAITDKAGQFSVDGMKASLYFVMAERIGFIQQTSRLSTLALKPGQHLTDYKIAMAARALIVGHALDEYGDPVEHVNVQLQPVSPNSQMEFMFARASVQTDDRGEFRLIAGPGKYFLKAAAGGQAFGGGAPEVRTDGTPSAPFTTTYYPSAASTGAASVIDVAAGQDLAGVDIHLLRTAPGTARGLTVSGVVIGMPENDRASVTLRFGESAGQSYNMRSMITEADGTFKFTGMQPGYYAVAASYTEGKTTLQSHPVEFHLESADETGLQLTLAPGEELTGKLEFTGDAPAGESAKHTVRLESAGQGNPFQQGAPPAAEVAPDGSFRISGISPGKFKPVVDPMPENAYLKEVALDNKSVPDDILDFTQRVGGSRLKIIVSRNGGRISGRVLDKDGQPAVGLVVVFLARDAKHMDEENPARALNGKYEFKSTRPGKYRLIALDVAELMSAFNMDGDNEEVMQRVFESAEEIEVKEGDAISKDLTALTKMPEKKEAP